MNQLLVIEIVGSFVIFFGGVGFHFLYKYGGKKKWMAVISPVNESIWEHLKLAFYPVLLYSVIQYFLLKLTSSSFFATELIGIYVMIFLIVLLEWFYPLFTKKNIFVVDLSIFYICILISQLLSYYLQISDLNLNIGVSYILAIILFQTLVFGLLSFYPLRLPLFKDSVTKKYGMK